MLVPWVLANSRMLAVGSVLMSDPKLIPSDEISVGLAPLVVRNICRILSIINSEWNVTLLIVEQNAKVALQMDR